MNSCLFPSNFEPELSMLKLSSSFLLIVRRHVFCLRCLCCLLVVSVSVRSSPFVGAGNMLFGLSGWMIIFMERADHSVNSISSADL